MNICITLYEKKTDCIDIIFTLLNERFYQSFLSIVNCHDSPIYRITHGLCHFSVVDYNYSVLIGKIYLS